MVAIITLAWVLNMPDMEEHPVLAFFSPDSESCTRIKLTGEVIAGVTSDHWGADTPDAVHTLDADAEYCGKHTALPLPDRRLASPPTLLPAYNCRY